MNNTTDDKNREIERLRQELAQKEREKELLEQELQYSKQVQAKQAEIIARAKNISSIIRRSC